MSIGDSSFKVPGVMIVRKIINRFFHKGIDESKRMSVLRHMFNQKTHGNKYADDFLLQLWYTEKWRYDDEDKKYYDELYIIYGDYITSGALKNEEKGLAITESGSLLYTTYENIYTLKCRTWIALVTAVASILLGILNLYCKCS